MCLKTRVAKVANHGFRVSRVYLRKGRFQNSQNLSTYPKKNRICVSGKKGCKSCKPFFHKKKQGISVRNGRLQIVLPELPELQYSSSEKKVAILFSIEKMRYIRSEQKVANRSSRTSRSSIFIFGGEKLQTFLPPKKNEVYPFGTEGCKPFFQNF